MDLCTALKGWQPQVVEVLPKPLEGQGGIGDNICGRCGGTHTCVICRLSWFPRRIVIRSRCRTLRATSSDTVSTE